MAFSATALWPQDSNFKLVIWVEIKGHPLWNFFNWKKQLDIYSSLVIFPDLQIIDAFSDQPGYLRLSNGPVILICSVGQHAGGIMQKVEFVFINFSTTHNLHEALMKPKRKERKIPPRKIKMKSSLSFQGLQNSSFKIGKNMKQIQNL